MTRGPTVAVLLVCGALVAAACGGKESDEVGGGRTVITVQVSGEPEETAVYDLVARAFEQENSDVDVKLVEVADKDDHLAKLTTSFAAGNPPDVFLANYREYSQFVTRGALKPVGPMLEGAGVDLGAYYSEPLEAFTYNGVLQCMPQNVSSLVVYYNTALFARAGVAPPRDDWTWQEFRDTALRLTTAEVKGLGVQASIIRIAPFVWSNGGELVDDPVAPTRFTLADPPARQALEFLVSMVRDDKVVPTETELAAQNLESRFVGSRLAMLLASRRETPALREVRGLEWDVAPLPVARQRAGILHSDGYCVSQGSSRLEPAMRFVRFATGASGQSVAALSGRTVPSLRSVAASVFLDPSRPPAHSQVFLDAIPVIRRTPVIPTWPEIEDVAAKVLHKAFYSDGYDIDDALRELEVRTAELFKEGSPSG